MAATDNLDRGELQKDLGTAWGVGLILSDPELMVLAYRSQGWTKARYNRKTKKFVLGKKTEGVEWGSEQIALEIQNSRWYKNRDGSTRMAENARLSDPATWQRNVSDIASNLQKQAAQMGANLGDLDVADLAERILKENYLYIDRSPDGKIPDSVVSAFLVPYINPNEEGKFGGKAGMDAAQIRATAREYGVNLTDKFVLQTLRGLQDGTTTEQDVLSYIVTQAKSAWGPLGEKISETTSTAALASSYIATLANTLELDEDSIDLNTPEIKNALMFTDPASGQVRQKSLWEFEKELRNDQRWDTTKQGQAELGDAAMMMLRDFGFWK